MFNRFSILITFFLFINMVFGQKAVIDDKYIPQQGLYFLSHTVDFEKRTGLNLTPQKTLNLKDGFELSFDIKLRKEEHNYGYIFRININDSLNIDLVSNIWLDKNYFALVKNTEEFYRTELTDITDYIDNWISIKVKADVQNQEIIFSVNNNPIVIKNKIPPFQELSIFFGKNRDSRLYVNDVAPMTIRNILIFDNKNNLKRDWPLFKHAKNDVYDEVANEKATVLNPVWEIDKHVYWEKRGEIIIDGLNPQIAYDEKKGRIFIAKNKDLYIYSINENAFDTIAAVQGNPYVSVANSIIYDPLTDQLISYNNQKDYLIRFDFNKKQWYPQSNDFYNTIIQHNQIIDTDNNELVIFGGYGMYHYNAQLSQFKLDSSGWKVNDLSAFITPRYLSAAAYAGDRKMLVFGGYGSKSGKQEESPQNHYDLYQIDIDSLTCHKKWGFKDDNSHHTFSNSMVIDKRNNCFYVLAYENDRNNTYIQLNRFGLDEPDKMLLGDSIPYKFYDIKSYCNLFMNPEGNELITVIYYAYKDDQTKVSIYSLPFPPLSKDEIYQEVPTDNNHKRVICIIIIAVVIILAGSSYLMYSNKKSKETEDISADENQHSLHTIKKRTSSILLLGSFQIIDVDGNDITGRFTHIIKNLFLFILINTLKNEKGVTSHQIDETIWSNMDKSNAMNNRNVNMSKLRNAIKDLPGINIVSKNSYWFITVSEEVFCDYGEILHLINELEQNNNYDLDKVNRILEFGIRGGLLSNTTSSWLDNYKSEYSNSIIDLLSKVSITAVEKKDYKLLLKISNVMLAIDSIDEDGIKLKCKALYYLGKKRLARKSYNDFCEEYQKILDAPLKLQFDDIIK